MRAADSCAYVRSDRGADERSQRSSLGDTLGEAVTEAEPGAVACADAAPVELADAAPEQSPDAAPEQSTDTDSFAPAELFSFSATNVVPELSTFKLSLAVAFAKSITNAHNTGANNRAIILAD